MSSRNMKNIFLWYVNTFILWQMCESKYQRASSTLDIKINIKISKQKIFFPKLENQRSFFVAFSQLILKIFLNTE